MEQGRFSSHAMALQQDLAQDVILNLKFSDELLPGQMPTSRLSSQPLRECFVTLYILLLWRFDAAGPDDAVPKVLVTGHLGWGEIVGCPAAGIEGLLMSPDCKDHILRATLMWRCRSACANWTRTALRGEQMGSCI